jgi:hypothetical protein
VKCSRETCLRKARTQGLCEQHYRLAVRGYVDAKPVRAHLDRLHDAGYTWRQIAELSGVTEAGFYGIGEKVQARTAHAVLAVPVPVFVAGNKFIPAVGSIRRVQALAAMGWPQVEIAARIGVDQRGLSHMLRQQFVTGKTAQKIRRVFDELHMTPGPSRRTMLVARNWGYVTSMAWDDMDDPDEKPNRGVHQKVPFAEQYLELRELGYRDHAAMASKLGVSVDAFERQYFRHNLHRDAA